MSMAFLRPKVLLVGHSFFTRLDRAMASPLHNYCVHNFGLDQCQVQFYAKGGLKIVDNIDLLKSDLRARFATVHYDAVLVQLGDNDCCTSHFCPLGLASKLDDFGQWLINECGVKTVFICQLFSRPHPRGVTAVEFENRRTQANYYLQTLLEQSERVVYWKHKRVFQSPHNLFLVDGCHLNVIGMKKYYKSVKQAIILAVEQSRNF